MPPPILSFFIGSSMLLFSCTPSTPPQPAAGSAPTTTAITFRQPAEYEPMTAVWLLWSRYDHQQGMPNAQVSLDIINALTPAVKVRLVVPNDSVRQAVQKLLPADWLEYGKVTLYTLPYNEFWARDMGPTFVVGSDGHLKVVDFGFNGWGTVPETDSLNIENEQLDEKVAEALQLPKLSTAVISEGGDREINAKGTLIVSEVVEQGRNPTMSLSAIEAEFKRLLGAKKVIWLKKGLYEDDHSHLGPINGPGHQKFYTVLTTNGHVDEYVRWANDSTVLLAAVDATALKHDPIARENAKRLAENYQILRAASDQDGRPLHIIRVPLPPLITGSLRPKDGVYELLKAMDYRDGSVFPAGKPVKAVAAASYLNFLIANGVVLMPKYGKIGGNPAFLRCDAAAQAALQQAFPNRKIVPIDALAVNWGGGGIHCITMNEPALR